MHFPGFLIRYIRNKLFYIFCHNRYNNEVKNMFDTYTVNNKNIYRINIYDNSDSIFKRMPLFK